MLRTVLESGPAYPELIGGISSGYELPMPKSVEETLGVVRVPVTVKA